MKRLFIPCIILASVACKKQVTDPSQELNSPPPPQSPPISGQSEEKTSPSQTIEYLRVHLSLNPENKPALAKQKFASTPISPDEAEQAIQLLFKDRVTTLRAERKKEFDAKAITLGDQTLRYDYRITGNQPEDGHSLYISMHGGGGAPAKVNDQQWANQIKLYEPKEGIYLAPRAPTDTWNLWHRDHIDPLFDRLIENFITFKGINPNKVYIMGYSAGGDGTYQLAPRMADRWAAAAMMAGHPGDAKTYNLRNLPYFIQCGGKDNAYNRAKLAADWGRKLDQLAEANPGSYPHKTVIYPDYGHWMQRADRQAVPWMAEFTRNPWPKKIHWYQDNATHTRFYWLENTAPKAKQLITAEIDSEKPQTITLTIGDSQGELAINAINSKKPGAEDGRQQFPPIESITLRLSDQLIDLDKPLIVRKSDGTTLYQGKVHRSIEAIATSLTQRPDPSSAATATLTLNLTQAQP
ncbi:dienelactone hydrolase family protein [Verrucomicrobiaceae bacterium R5-34]|nr:dienelactone hydrolase family protein [Verrucomicrobiaceae bacterium R5-34]